MTRVACMRLNLDRAYPLNMNGVYSLLKRDFTPCSLTSLIPNLHRVNTISIKVYRNEITESTKIVCNIEDTKECMYY